MRPLKDWIARLRPFSRVRERLDGISKSVTLVDKRTKAVSRQLKETDRRLDNIYRQIAGYVELRTRIEPGIPIPPLRGFAISPDMAIHLIDTIETVRPSRLLECGSGFSTVLMARYCASTGATLVSMEHDPLYLEKTRSLLARSGLEAHADVVWCPLKEGEGPEGGQLFYDADVLFGRAPATPFDFVFVDGPPMAFGDRIRGGLLPRLVPLLAPNALIVMDDFCRKGEQDVAEGWREAGYVELVETHTHLEKHAAHLRVAPEVAKPPPGSSRS